MYFRVIQKEYSQNTSFELLKLLLLQHVNLLTICYDAKEGVVGKNPDTGMPCLEGESAMRVGTVFLILVLILIGSGFLLSDNLNTHDELASVQKQLERSIKEKESIQKQLDSAFLTITEINKKVESLTSQKAALQDEVRGLQDENRSLQEQNGQLQQQISQQVAFASLTEYLANPLNSPLGLAIFIPIIPISMAATYIVARGKRHNVLCTSPDDLGKNKSAIWVQLTEAEMKHLIRIRRGRQIG